MEWCISIFLETTVSEKACTLSLIVDNRHVLCPAGGLYLLLHYNHVQLEALVKTETGTCPPRPPRALSALIDEHIETEGVSSSTGT